MIIIRFINLFLLAFLGAGCSLFGVRNEEQPKYKVLFKEDKHEVREYQSHIIAKTTVQGSFEEAQSQGFKILAGYIFGKNKSKTKIAMTSPVVQKADSPSEKISMTAPVVIAPDKLTEQSQVSSWTMTFSLPSKYSLEDLPTPNDQRVIIEQVPSRYVAATLFSGFWNESKNKKIGFELLKWLEQKNQFKAISEPMFAGYNPPWTLPFFRRNEMLIEIEAVR